jgi:hypothetical protein
MSNRRNRLFLALYPLATIALGCSFAFASATQETASVSEQTANKAAKVTVTSSGFTKEAASQPAPAGKAFFILDTEWKNIHPKQKIEKSKLEGKQDRTMGVGGLMGGGKSEKKEEMVDADVAYLVPSFFDHAYLLADGETYSLDKLTETVPGGFGLKKDFSLPKQGDLKKVRFVYLIPENAKNVAFQFFDYSYGHILIPLKGDLKLAAGTAAAKSKALGSLKDEYLELSATAINFGADYGEVEAPEGWRCAVVKLSGKSLSGSATKKDIVQIEPTEYIWLATKNGHIYYSCGGSTTDDGFIRFTPEFAQSQEVAFIVPASEKEFSLGLRVQNRVYALALNTPPPDALLAKPQVTHKDGNTLEVLLFGARREKGRVILDLGIRSLVKSGAEIQAAAQFILKAGGGDVSFDEDATNALPHRPPTPFTIPPQTFVRFELAYETAEVPESLRYRGFASEKYFDLSQIFKR